MTDTLYRMRGLEWVSINGSMWAFTPAGKYVIRLMLSGPRKGQWRWRAWSGPANYADSLSAAQSAAEAYYRARMAEGLVGVKVLGELQMDKRGRVVGGGQHWTIHQGKVTSCHMVLMRDEDMLGNALAFEPDEDGDAEDLDECHDLFETCGEAIDAIKEPTQ